LKTKNIVSLPFCNKINPSVLSLEGNKKSRAADVSSSSRSRWPTREPKPSANFHLSAAPRSRSLTPRKPFFLFRDQTLSLSASPFPPLSLSLDLKQFSQFPTGKPKRKKTMTIISAKVSSSSPAAAAARPSKVIAIDASTPRAAPKVRAFPLHFDTLGAHSTFLIAFLLYRRIKMRSKRGKMESRGES